MSGILERTMILGEVRLSGKRRVFVPFPWELVGSGPASGWEPAEWQPMGRVADINRLRHKASPNVLASSIEVKDYALPYFYDDSSSQRTILHGGHVQMI